jgi:hypothetical protein
LTITGAGAASTIIDGGGIDRVFHIVNDASSATVTISGVTIRNGRIDTGGDGGGIRAEHSGIFNLNDSVVTENWVSPGSSNGGGIFIIDGTANLNRVTVSNNFASGGGGGISNALSTVYIDNTCINGNTTDYNGGGLLIRDATWLTNVTISGNTAQNDGGGIYNDTDTTVYVNNVTIYGNSALSITSGGGIFNDEGEIRLQNTIIAGNLVGGDCDVDEGTFTSLGSNIDSDGTCNLGISGDQPNTNPLLGLLGNYGGSTQTHILFPNSPAIDRGQSLPLTIDQRGFPRPMDGNNDGSAEWDIGAFELQRAYRIADSILFPWVVKSDDVTTVISVVNTAETWAESVGLPFHDNRIHIEYWHKLTTANDQEEKCTEYNFEVTSSKDDMVTWDMAGHFNNGLPMFNDTSNEVIAVPDMTLAVENPRRAFLIVDNFTDALIDAGTNLDGTMYGEATIIEHQTGAAWGYIAYNAIGGPDDFSDADYRDQQGEVIGDSETTQTTLLNPNDAITKLFVTPTFDEGNPETDIDQRRGNLNASIQLCRFPERNGDGDPYSGACTGGGIWNNEEGGFSFTTKKDIVCTTADNIVDFFGGAGTSAYTQWVASGKAGWAYLITESGNIDNRDGTESYEESDEAIIGKLEYGTSLNWDGSIADTINTFVWLRDNTNYLRHCAENPGDPRCEPGGINIIHNEYYQEEALGACCLAPLQCTSDKLTQSECYSDPYNGVLWVEGGSCEDVNVCNFT